jgi:hypothetical protein
MAGYPCRKQGDSIGGRVSWTKRLWWVSANIHVVQLNWLTPHSVTMPQDARPGRHILHLDFNHFRTIGLRRSVGEGVHSRFVTGERLELALKVGILLYLPCPYSSAPGRKCRTS